MSRNLLDISDLHVAFDTRQGTVQAIRGLSLSVAAGEALAIVGESGSGKSVTAQTVMGLVDVPGRITGGTVSWNGQPLVEAGVTKRPKGIWGKEIAMVFQDPMTSLNPLMTIGAQMAEGMQLHLGLSRRAAWAQAAELLAAVGISGPQRRLQQYPHEFSGGMRQRVMIAMAISCNPRLLIADEPTTALDVTIQAQILELLAKLQASLGLAIILITHDLGIVAGLCQRVAVMYAGQIIETGGVDDIFEQPAHPYTQGLLRSSPQLDGQDGLLLSIDGTPPGLIHPPQGCGFYDRCPARIPDCRKPQRLQPCAQTMAACCRAGIQAWQGGAA